MERIHGKLFSDDTIIHMIYIYHKGREVVLCEKLGLEDYI